VQGEREKDREVLIGRYGVSRRLATRVVALLQSRVDFSATLLETATPGSPAEKVLLSPQILREPEALDTRSLQDLGRRCGLEGADLLVVVEDEQRGWRTIAFEDDVLAEQAEREAEGDEATVVGQLVKAAPKEITRSETQELFSAQVVAQLKLSALTSQDTRQRTEALRKLVFAPIEGAQKAGIFVNVLIDPEAEARVRREAVRSLEQIGFRPDLAEAIRGIFESEQQEAVYSIQRLGALLNDAELAEKSVALAVALEMLGQPQQPSIVSELLPVVASQADVLVQNVERTERFIRGALRQLARHFGRLRRAVEDAIASCHRQSPTAVGDILWREVLRSENALVRSFLLNLVGSLLQGTERVEEIASRAVSEILNPELRESERARLRYGLVKLGEPAARVALQRLREGPAGDRPELVRLLNAVCTEGDVSEQIVNAGARALLDLLKVADKGARRMVLDASLCADARVEKGVRRQLAAEILEHMAEFQLPDTHGTIRDTLEKLGVEAARPILDYAKAHYAHKEAADVLRILGSIVGQNPHEIPDELLEDTLRYGTELFEDKKLKQGAFTIVLANIAGYTDKGKQVFDQVLEKMTQNLWRSAYSFDMLDALGVIAGSPNAGPQHQKALFETFDRIVSMKSPDEIGVKRETQEGVVYVFGREIDFDIVVVPAVVRGLDRICSSEQASLEIRQQIVKRFLVLWEGVSHMRIVWSPAAIDALVRAMCNAACCPQVSVDMRIRLANSLLRCLNKLSVVRSIGQICAQCDRAGKMQPLCVEAARKLMREWENCDQQDDERKEALLRSIGHIAANSSLDRDDEAILKLRKDALGVLFGGLREGIDAVLEPLEVLRDCPDITEEQRREINERIGKTFGLLKVSDR